MKLRWVRQFLREQSLKFFEVCMILLAIYLLIGIKTSSPIEPVLLGLKINLVSIIGLMGYHLLEKLRRRAPKWTRYFGVVIVVLLFLSWVLILGTLAGDEGWRGIVGKSLLAIFTGLVAGLIVLLGSRLFPAGVEASVDWLRKWLGG